MEDAAVPVDGDGHGDAPVDGGHEGVVARLKQAQHRHLTDTAEH